MTEGRARVARVRLRTAAKPNSPGSALKPSTGLLRVEEKRVLWVLGTGILIAVLFPSPVIKFTLAGVLGTFLFWLFMTDLPLALCLLPIIIPANTLFEGTFNILPGVNYETLLIALVVVAWSSQRGAWRPFEPAKPMPAFVGLLIAFLVVLILASAQTFALGTPPIFELVQIYKNQWIYVVLLFVVADALRQERERQRLMVAVCIAMILLAIQPIYNATYELARGASLLRHRAVSLIAIQPNIYGGALACFMPFPLLYFARKIGGKKGRVLFGLSAGVAGYVLVLTLSRGSWLATGAASLMIGVLFERRVLLILVLVGLSAPFWVPEDAVDRASEMKAIDVNDPNLKEDEGSAFVRVDQWRMIPSVLVDSPIFGHGYQRFPWVYKRFGAYGWYKGAHVGYAEYAAEAGMIGLFFYLSIFVALAAFGLRLAWSGTSAYSRAHGVGLLGSAVAMAVAEGFGSRLKVGSVTAFLWMYAAVGIACWRWPAGEAEEAGAVERERRGLVRRRRGSAPSAANQRFSRVPGGE